MEGVPEQNETKQAAQETIKLMPTEFRCIDPSVDGTILTDEDIEIKDLEIKVEGFLHDIAGDAGFVGSERATQEDVRRFVELLQAKASQYSKLVSELEKINIPQKTTE